MSLYTTQGLFALYLQQDNKVEHVTDAKDVPEGAKRDNRGRLVFEGFPDFRPTLTPRQARLIDVRPWSFSCLHCLVMASQNRCQ